MQRVVCKLESTQFGEGRHARVVERNSTLERCLMSCLSVVSVNDHAADRRAPCMPPHVPPRGPEGHRLAARHRSIIGTPCPTAAAPSHACDIARYWTLRTGLISD